MWHVHPDSKFASNDEELAMHRYCAKLSRFPPKKVKRLVEEVEHRETSYCIAPVSPNAADGLCVKARVYIPKGAVLFITKGPIRVVLPDCEDDLSQYYESSAKIKDGLSFRDFTGNVGIYHVLAEKEEDTSTKTSNAAYWCNHSCNPNAQAIAVPVTMGNVKVNLVAWKATKDIYIDQEITYNYYEGTAPTALDAGSVRCNCSPGCPSYVWGSQPLMPHEDLYLPRNTPHSQHGMMAHSWYRRTYYPTLEYSKGYRY